ncbi:LuxR C-terminal-related transcriptional regulator [Microbacterium sp. RU33B]|uniref:response regulator transcription factor n=1 Tax=Microbacterium sp. RU33B TaxID=1907390 RepID=UPI0015C2DFAD|nr:response regulator transcription factor [Microbacterium sp. RU33B]
MPIRIGIIDDHPALLLGTAALLNRQDDLKVVATGRTVDEFLRQQAAVDIVILDLFLADGSTPRQNILDLRPVDALILAYTSGEHPQLVRQAGQAGATAMVRKSDSASTLIEAVRSISRGEEAASADWAAALDSDPDLEDARLSERERQVLALYASGETAESVAKMLFISRETVNDHIRRIRSKYATVERPASTKVDLYRRAIEDGLV